MYIFIPRKTKDHNMLSGLWNQNGVNPLLHREFKKSITWEASVVNSIAFRTKDRDTQRERRRERESVCKCPTSSGSSSFKKDQARERSTPNVETLAGYKCLINEMKNDTCYRSGHISLSMAFVMILHIFFSRFSPFHSLSNLFMP